MNPLTINQFVVAACRVAGFDFLNKKPIADCPLLTARFAFRSAEDVVHRVKTHPASDSECVAYPYPCIRFHIENECPDRDAIFGLRWHDANAKAFTFCRSGADDLLLSNDPFAPLEIRVWVIDVKRKTFRETSLQNDKALRTHALILEGIFILMELDYVNPANHLALVRPGNTEGKSVEWVRARQHYVVIHRTHEANKAGIAEGSVIKSDEQRQLSRMAHSRRAHYRLLKSPRFKHKQGQRTLVKSTWVGPKEWRGESRQIYRIVDGLPSLTAAAGMQDILTKNNPSTKPR